MKRRALLIVVAVAALCVPGGTAAAHAVLESSSPSDGQRLDAPPDEIRLEFNEPVTLTQGGLRIHDASGDQVPLGALGDTDSADVIRVPLDERPGDGSYIVTWRVASADGHPVAGALVFSVGDPDEIAASLVRQVFAGGDDPLVGLVVVLVRWLGYLTLLVAAGGVAFLAWVADQRDRATLARVVAQVAAAGAALALLAVPVQAAQVSGEGFVAILRADQLGAALTGSLGLQSVLQAFALIAVAFAVRHGGARVLLTAGLPAAVVAALAVVVAGHTRTTEPLWLTVVADAVHVLAAALWLGGLVLLWSAMRRRRFADDAVGAARTVARFSLLATIAVGAVGVAGLVLSWLLVRTVPALLSTGYGRVLIVKVLLAVVVMAAGAYNHRRLVPAVAAAVDGPLRLRTPAAVGVAHAGGGGSDSPDPPYHTDVAADAAPPPAARAWRRLRTTVRLEVAGLVLVVAATAVVVGMQPAAEAAGVTGALNTSVAVGDGSRLSITVDPNSAGYNEIHLFLLDDTGRPADVTELELRMTLPDQDIGPIVRAPSTVSPGHWLHAGRELAVPGRWQIEAVIGVSRFEQRRVPVTADVRP